MVDEPLTYELLRELALRLAILELLLIAVGIEIPTGIGGMDLVDEIHLSIALTELILGINQDQTLTGGNLLTSCEDLAGVVLHDLIVLLTDNTLSDDLLLGDIHVMTLIGLGGWGDDRLGETLVLAHAIGQLHAAELPAAVLVLTPGRTCEDGADDHLYAESFAFQTHRYHRVGSGQFPVRTDIRCGVQELGCNLVQHLSFIRNTLGQYHIKRRDSVGCHHYKNVVVDVIDITHLTMIHTLLTIEMEISPC